MVPGRFQEIQHRALQGLVHRISRLRRESVSVESLRMPYLTAGAGDPVILLHGFADQKETWSLVGRLLSSGHRIYAPDLPGFGAADRIPADAAGTRILARYVRGFMDALGLARVHVVGNSMGGGIAQRLAAAWPERVQTVSLVCSMGPDIHKSQFTQHRDERGGNVLIPQSMDEYMAMLAWVFERKPPFPGVVLRHMARRQMERAADFTAYFHTLETEWVWAEVAPVPQPTLIIQGRRDRVIHPATARGLAEELPDTRLLMLAGTGHAPQWEKPRVTADALRDFFHSQPIG
jgi:pimeloyl-ACP methyl ester carboxylesterase